MEDSRRAQGSRAEKGSGDETKSSAARHAGAVKTPRLLQRMKHALRSRHYSPKTERTYCLWVKQFVVFNEFRHPDEMGEREINAFLSHLAVNKRVSASTQNQALSALRFLYRHVLGRDVGDLGDVVRAKRPKRLPVVMTRDEANSLMECLKGQY